MARLRTRTRIKGRQNPRISQRTVYTDPATFKGRVNTPTVRTPEDEINEHYDKEREKYLSDLAQRRTYERTQARQRFDEDNRNAYINSELTKKDLDESLARRGITGGATESARLGATTLYENQKENIRKRLDTRLGEIDKNYAEDSNAYQLASNAERRAELSAERNNAENRKLARQKLRWARQDRIADRKERKLRFKMAQKEFKQRQSLYRRDLKDRKDSIYAQNVKGYTNPKTLTKIIKRIEKLKKTNPKEYERISYRMRIANVRRAELLKDRADRRHELKILNLKLQPRKRR